MAIEYDVVIGLEIHAQLSTLSKCFSSDSTEFGGSHNENVTEVTAGMPGTLPVLNEKAVELAVKAGLILNCEIQKTSVFSRKQYFYPDMPKGYQITQYDQPIALKGRVEFYVDGKKRSVALERAHMEEDAGKSTHHGEYTLINLNRSGIPLLEIVSMPVIETPEEAAAYVKAVRQSLRYADVCDGNLEEGSLRCDCNVSIKPKGQKELGVKVELKNINSYRFIEKALYYEISRQIQCLNLGEQIIQETRLYDSTKNKTFSMRKKEEANDYRYFPDADLMPLVISQDYIDKINSQLPEKPLLRMERFINELELAPADATLLVNEKEIADYFEELYKRTKDAKLSCNWMTGEFLRRLNDQNQGLREIRFSIDDFAELLKFIINKKISGTMAKDVFEEMWSSGKSPQQIVKDKGLEQISDESVLLSAIDKIILDNPKVVVDYQSGKVKLFGFFVGQVMKATKGSADPEIVNQLLKERLK
jgi:aspartyl-tRNA(Asn)/glutamyl-tRNA(Gln) amidotransferase subunit B